MQHDPHVLFLEDAGADGEAVRKAFAAATTPVRRRPELRVPWTQSDLIIDLIIDSDLIIDLIIDMIIDITPEMISDGMP